MIYIKQRFFYRILLGIALACLLVLIIAAANLGVARISFGQTLGIMISRIPILNHWLSLGPPDQTARLIILNLRLPRILLAALLGAGLGVAGAGFQGIFKNPMADPFILGISSGAAVGASLAMVLGRVDSFFSFGTITIAAFGGGLVTVLLVYHIARVGSRIPNITLLLSGIAVNLFLTAIMSLVMTFQREQIEGIVMWTMGSVATANWLEVSLIFPVVLVSSGGIAIFARDLNVLATGDETAHSLGIAVERVKKTVLTIATFMVAALVSVSGVVGFVGLIVPHMVRMGFGPDHRVVLPFSALGGAMLLVICDTLARSLAPPNEIPLGIITSLLGVPFFLYLIANTKKKVL